MSETTKRLWNTEEVANFLNVGKLAIYKKVQRGTIPYIKMGNGSAYLRFDPDVIQDFVKQHSVRAWAYEK